jgi:purine-binding chemotaxis protein CheW
MDTPEIQNMVEPSGFSSTLRFLRCSVADTTYCLSMTHVRGIRRVEELQSRRPSTEPCGWLASESGNIPVFRLARLLKQTDSEETPTGKILLLKTHPSPMGLLVDRLDSVIQVSTREVFPLPTLARNPTAAFFEGVVQHNETMMLILSPAGLHPETAGQTSAVLPLAATAETLYAGVGVSNTVPTTRQLVQFTTAPEPTYTFGLSLSQVPQILRPPAILSVPGAAPYVVGLVEWRHVPLTVLDLSRRLGGATVALTADSRLLVARATRTRAFAGLVIRPQISMHPLPLAHRVSTRYVPLQESLLRGRFELKNDVLLIPDLDRLLVTHDDAMCPEHSVTGQHRHA